MRTSLRFFFCPLLTAFTILTSFSGIATDRLVPAFPYKKAGLTERQAAAHLLDRFTFGAGVGDVDQVLKTGLEKWFSQQLRADRNDTKLKEMISGLDVSSLSNEQILKKYPQNARILAQAVKDGYIDKDALAMADRKDYRDELMRYMNEKGYKPQAELYRQLINQKVLRATFSENQLQEVLTDFWFNHFNVSVTKNSCADFIPAYERDVIRPNVYGKFGNLLLATAKSPAMLLYLDNFSSSGVSDSLERPVMKQPPRKRVLVDTSKRGHVAAKVRPAKNNQGLNENYAREVMELHTLGVDGGYTQSDVTQAARILTGWTVYPMENGVGGVARAALEKIGEQDLEKRGFVREGDFLFAANRHDKGQKVVMGKVFPAGGGYQDGVELLKFLSGHKSTARFISTKIAIRFVSDVPPKSLVDKMAATFERSQGNISAVLETMVSAPEFWSKEALREKTKSPFELAISALRSLDASISQPYQVFNWVNRMGQKIYYYQAPTGFPDKAQYWINSGSLLNRMNFGLALASQKIPGVTVDLLALNNNREPESAEAALLVYSKLIMPERDVSNTVERLTPMLNDPELQQKVERAAAAKGNTTDGNIMQAPGKTVVKKNATDPQSAMLAQVVGVILGSPEFQRK